LAVPPTEEIYHVIDWIKAHGMTATRRWHIAVSIHAVQFCPDCMWLRSMQVRIKQAGFGNDGEELFCSLPVSSEHYAFVELRDEGVFQLYPGSGDDGFVGSEKATLS
jgi:hypothetical protein